MGPKRRDEESEELEAEAVHKPTPREVKQRQLRILLVSILVIAVLAIGGSILYNMYVAPYRRAVINVDGHTVSMDYFLKRARMAGDDISTTIQQLTYEEIVKIEAPKLGVTVSSSDVNTALRQAAAASNNSTSISETDFKKWYSEQLKDARLSDAQYRDMVKVRLMGVMMQQALAAQVPNTAEQVHLNVIVLNSLASAQSVKARLTAGENFASLAKQFSVDSQTSPYGGDLGWVAKGVLPYDDVVFSLAVGQVSDPVPTNPSNPSQGQYLLFMVSEIDPARPVDASTKQVIGYNQFQAWLNQELSQHTISYPGLDNPSTQAWVRWQLSKD